MKCDELKDYDYDPDFPFQSRGRFYVADEVEAAIDELKAEHHKERHEYIKIIAELKQKLEDAQASAYADSVDAGMRERRLRRALYKAIANWAKVTRLWDGSISMDIYDKWDNVERKCRAKAEEYK